MTSLQKGEIAVCEVIRRSVEKGYIPSRPLIEGTRYDLLLERAGQFWRIQVKYVSGCDGTANVPFRKFTRNTNRLARLYSADEVDAVVVYVPQTDSVYWLPPEVWVGKRWMMLRYAPCKNGQRVNLKLAETYKW